MPSQQMRCSAPRKNISSPSPVSSPTHTTEAIKSHTDEPLSSVSVASCAAFSCARIHCSTGFIASGSDSDAFHATSQFIAGVIANEISTMPATAIADGALSSRRKRSGFPPPQRVPTATAGSMNIIRFCNVVASRICVSASSASMRASICDSNATRNSPTSRPEASTTTAFEAEKRLFVSPSIISLFYHL